MLIIGFGVGMVSLSVGNSSGKQLDRAAKDFANQAALLAEEAILSRTAWAVDLYRSRDEDSDNEQVAYRWLQQDKEGSWQVITPEGFAPGGFFPLQVDVELIVESDEQLLETHLAGAKVNKPQPDIALFSSGEITPFTLELIHSEDDIRKRIEADSLGRFNVY